jgi:hypothetical protein
VSLGRKRRGRQNGDPLGSENPRGKDSSEQRGRNDPGWTGTERTIRDGLMRQFLRLDGPKGVSDEYRNSPCWGPDGRLKP